MASARKLTSKIYEIQAHAQKVTCLDLGETGRVLVTGGQDRNVNLWAFGNDKCFMSLPGHNGQIDCVKFAYNDDYVYSADINGVIKRWDLNAQPGCSTFYGHMKSVRTLDFHPYGEYVVSGSNDTSVRLWDVRKNNTCIENYRGHIANVNSVKFSPDGSWIASSGTEGCVIIWDIRMRKKIIEFQEHASPITCIQFHPFEFLLAVGRNDGSVDLYDLEKKALISRTDSNSAFNGHTVKCISFSESGECLFVGTAEGISVIGWEPDREFDHIESAWSILGDMKVINKKLFCGSYENQTVKIHDIHIDQVIPFLNPSLNKMPFSHSSSSRKSFSRSNSKLRVSIGKSTKKLDSFNETTSDQESSVISTTNEQDAQSPNGLSFEMIEESDDQPSLNKNKFNFDQFGKTTITPINITTPTAAASALSSTTTTTTADRFLYGTDNNFMETISSNPNQLNHLDDSSSSVAEHYIENYSIGDLDYYPMRSNPDAKHVVEPEREDFPVNNAQPPDYAPKMDISMNHHHNYHHQPIKSSSMSSIKHKTTIHRRHSPPNTSSNTKTFLNHSKKLSKITSVSTVDLHRIDDNMLMTSTDNNKKNTATGLAASRSRSPSRNYVSSSLYSNNNGPLTNHNSTGNGGGSSNNNNNTLSQLNSNNNNNNNNIMSKFKTTTTMSNLNTANTSQFNRENNLKNKKITVQIFAPPMKTVTRSRTSLDIRSSSANSVKKLNSITTNRSIVQPFNNSNQHQQHQQQQQQQYPQQYNHGSMSMNTEENTVINILTTQHENVYQQLSNRYASLQIIRNATRSHDILGALNHAIKMNDSSVLVDLVGAILEKKVTWNLDMCVILLPEIYELLQSDNKFHRTRACDTLRLIISSFLPIIQTNSDPWGPPRSLGVDISSEERRNKCSQCRHWLQRIKLISDNEKPGGMVSNLQQLQNLIVDL